MEIRRHQDGIIIYDPWYGRIMAPLEALERFLSLPATVELGGMTLTEILGQLVVRATDIGLEINIPVFSVLWLLAMRAAGKIYRGVRAHADVAVGVSASVEANVIAR